jgi:hypothetical protein
MPNTIRTIFTTRTRFALLALGAISLSGLTLPAMAGDDAPDGGTNNPSNCRDLVNHKCLTKPRDDQSGRNQDSRNQDKAAQARENARLDSIAGLVNSVGIARYDSSGRITQVDYPKAGFSDRSYSDEAIIRVYRNGQQKLIYVSGTHDKPGSSGGNGGAAGHTGSRIAPAPTRTSASAAAPKAATPKSTTTDKATNTTTRDYRTGATAAPGGPPPAAAIGSSTNATPEQLAAQSGGTRDHRRK